MPYVRAYGRGQFRCEVEKLGVRDSQIFDKKAEAREWGYKREAEIEAEKTGKGVQFGQATARYLKDVSTQKKDAVLWETRRMEAFKTYFGSSTPLLAIKQPQISKWRDWRLTGDESTEPVLGSTVNREANLLSSLFRRCRLEWHYMGHNPMEGIKWPDEEDPREVVWTWRQIRRVLRHCENSDGIKTQQAGIAFHIALRTGMRLKEVLQAHKEGSLAVLGDTKTTKKGKRVTLPLIHQGARLLERYAGIKWVIEPNEASVLFHKAALGCGVRKPRVDGPTFHDARATALTHMARKMPVEQLQRISRHKDINVLISTYYRETNEQIAARFIRGK